MQANSALLLPGRISAQYAQPALHTVHTARCLAHLAPPIPSCIAPLLVRV